MTRTHTLTILDNDRNNYEAVLTNNHIHTEDVLINNHTCYKTASALESGL
jgi:hypothetical protein